MILKNTQQNQATPLLVFLILRLCYKKTFSNKNQVTVKLIKKKANHITICSQSDSLMHSKIGIKHLGRPQISLALFCLPKISSVKPHSHNQSNDENRFWSTHHFPQRLQSSKSPCYLTNYLCSGFCTKNQALLSYPLLNAFQTTQS